ncbi:MULTISPECIES: hypothetical protein [Nocardioides]|uniref:Peptidase C39 domain-containing protein n=1 Tax=Nocardioides vastitatis TaxID=2568655 RepID=A0ABW0ZAW6_9ACTN|nr:hypothetical protein [Nocardioides sp.]THJ10509.1 hypothetical protein E7Z54_02845 [Nocardioides sp.]
MRWPADLDPADLRQPDGTTCGAAVALAARVLLEPGFRPTDPAAEIEHTHRLLTSSFSPRQRFQLPWPRALGTPPWALANTLAVLAGERVATVNARPRPEVGYDVLRAQLASRPVAVYLGSRWLPRHVVLAVSAVDGGVEVFDPASGRLVGVAEPRWTAHRVDLAGWSHVWFVV